jgi:hypothetical protein
VTAPWAFMHLSGSVVDDHQLCLAVFAFVKDGHWFVKSFSTTFFELSDENVDL